MSNLSVVVIARNEERIIERFMEGVKWAEEIIVVDDQSEDRTTEIASRYTDKIYRRALTSFAEQKNFGIGKATKEWILSIDADEIVTPELAQEIGEAVKSDEYDAYEIPLKNIFLGHWIKHGGFYPFSRIRLFKKSKGFWVRGIHEYVQVEGKVGKLKGPIEHHTVESISECMKTRDRFSELDAEELYSEGFRVGWWRLIYGPLRQFLGRFILRGGFLDGIHGFIWHALAAIDLFVIYAKVVEKQLGEAPVNERAIAKYCAKCGSGNTRGARNCIKCGADLMRPRNIARVWHRK